MAKTYTEEKWLRVGAILHDKGVTAAKTSITDDKNLNDREKLSIKNLLIQAIANKKKRSAQLQLI